MAVALIALAGCSVSPEEQVDRIFTDYRGVDAPGAVVRVIKDGAPVLTRTYGMANIEEKIPIRPETNFRLASLTKQFTAMSILMLVERGELTLDDSLHDVFPDFADYGSAITMRNLLQHTSGIIDYEPFVPNDSPKQIVDREILELMKQQDHTYFPPGTEYRYSNSGYAVLAMVVERVSSQDFADFLHDNIFKPLDMTATVAHREGVSTVSNRAYGYHVGDNGVEFSDQSPWSAVLGDGGIYTSVIDLGKWDQALYDGNLVSSGLLQQAFTPNLENYGFGWRIDEYAGRKRMHHSGSTIGFRNFIQRFPDERLTVIVLSNRRDPEVDPLA
ncbi:MAG TPA: serine hydrolase domain-containing protein, partial [Woeseiaceae bacterium]